MKPNSFPSPQKGVLTLTELLIVIGLLAGAILSGGCGKPAAQADAPAAQNQKKYVDGSAVRKAFSTAGADIKYVLNQQVSIAEAGGFADALPQLQKIAAHAKMTPEQQQALTDFIQQIQARMAAQNK